MEPEGSLQHSQVPATCTYPEPARSSPYPTSHFSNIHLNIILLSTPGSPKWSLSLRFPHQTPVYTYSLPVHATWPAYLILLDFITRKILGEQYRSCSPPLCSFLHTPVISPLLGPNILLNALFPNTPYKTTYKNYSSVYPLIFKFLDSKLEDKRFCTES